MADKKPTKRSGAPGGDRPMRRRDANPETTTRGDARKKPVGGKPAFDKPAFAKPAFDKSRGAENRGEKAARPRPDLKRAKPRPAAAPVEKTSAFEGERLAKAMARAGVCSRRDAEEWIAAGRVAVNGKSMTSPAVNVTEADKITIDGQPMQARERTRLFLFHKPQGLVTTASDPEGRPTVFAFLEERQPELPRLVSVGRLDINTEGLLLLTNDGGLARTLELPATGWTRRYRVRVHGETDQARLDELKKGVAIDDVTYAPIEARLERVQGANAWIAVSLSEGKNREVKRVMEHLGLDVTRLIRISYGPFQLGDLAEGVVEEVKLKTLREQLGKSLAELAGADFASPLREATPTEQQEQRERSDKRSRKHVSVLRKQREQQSEKGPRARIERGATADRKGRAVVVERVTLTARKGAEDAPASRNGRRFEAMRDGDKPRRAAAAGERSSRGAGGRGERLARDERSRSRGPEGSRPRFEAERGERPARAPREGGEGRREAPRGGRSFERGADESPRGRSGAGAGGVSGSERANHRGEDRFEKRPPRRDGDAPPRTRQDSRDDARQSTRPPRAAAGRDERPRKFERPRSDRDVGTAERAPRKRSVDRPREGAEGRPPRADGPARGARSGPGRSSGFSKGPPRGRSAAPGKGVGKGPSKGPSKGPARGPGKGAPKGPRKPRGE